MKNKNFQLNQENLKQKIKNCRFRPNSNISYPTRVPDELAAKKIEPHICEGGNSVGRIKRHSYKFPGKLSKSLISRFAGETVRKNGNGGEQEHPCAVGC